MKPPSGERVGAIVVAAGSSRRMEGVDKVFAPLEGKPLLIHALRGRRSAITAQQLAQTLQVSLRTVYRDVAFCDPHQMSC